MIWILARLVLVIALLGTGAQGALACSWLPPQETAIPVVPPTPAPSPAATGPAAKVQVNTVSANAPNVVLITLDTARADRFGAYGNPNIKTPVIDELARRGAVFTNAYSQFSQTNPSHASIFTGNYPAVHKLMHHGASVITNEIPTLTEVLNWAGYKTAGIYTWPLFDPGWSGLEVGFENYIATYYNRFPEESNPHRARSGSADRTTDEVLNWLRGHRSGPFYLWVHYQDPHYPYVSPPPFETMYVPADCGRCPDGSWKTIDSIHHNEPYTEAEIASVVARYDGTISYTDRELGRLIDEMDRYRLLDNTIIIITSDHGEAFNENGKWFHPFILYNTVIRIPLVVVYPPAIPAGFRSDAVVRSIDIMPTVLDLAGVPIPHHVEGKSLMPIVRRTERDNSRTSVSQVLGNGSIAMISKDWKIIRDNKAGTAELYNLRSDPGEHTNLSEREPAILKQLTNDIKVWMETRGARVE